MPLCLPVFMLERLSFRNKGRSSSSWGMNQSTHPSLHRSHFGSRYQSGRCALRSPFMQPGRFDPCRCRFFKNSQNALVFVMVSDPQRSPWFFAMLPFVYDPLKTVGRVIEKKCNVLRVKKQNKTLSPCSNVRVDSSATAIRCEKHKRCGRLALHEAPVFVMRCVQMYAYMSSP